MITAQVIAELVAAGLSGEALVAACQRIEAANSAGSSTASSGKSARLDRIREYDRQRKAAKRDAQKPPETPAAQPQPAPIPAGIPAENTERGVGGESSFLPSLRDSEKKELEIQHAREPDPVDQLVTLWNETAADLGLSKVQHLTDARRKAARKRLAECDGIEGMRYAMAKIRESPGLQGKVGGRTWKANFDWLLQPSSFTKLMEGGYDHWQKPKSDLMAAADRLRERVSQGHRHDAQGGRPAGLFDGADGTGDLRDDHLSY